MEILPVGGMLKRRSGTVKPGQAARSLGHVVLTFKVFPEDDHFVADCTDLGVSSFGPTEEGALHAGLDAVMLYLKTITELGDMPRVFEERGIRIHPSPYPDEEDLTARHVEIRPMESAAVKVLEVPAGAGVG